MRADTAAGVSLDTEFRFPDLKGKTLVITGTTRGIGKAILPGLQRQGLRLVLVSKGKKQMEDAVVDTGLDASLLAFHDCDLANPEAVDLVARTIKKQEGKIDGILHNAAIDPRHKFDHPRELLWRDVFQINLFSPNILTRQLLPRLRRSRQGRIVFMGSIMDPLGGARLAAYASSKGALSTLTRSLAHELRGSGITVNCLVPGAIQVEKEKRVTKNHSLLINWQSVPRRLLPQDLLGPLCLLLSQAGSAITGQSITVDGGVLHPLASPEFQDGL